MGLAVGIDLGTTNSVVGVVRDGVASTLADPEGHRLIPSIVSFHPSGQMFVGSAARERRLIDGENTVYSVKRLIGRAWASAEVQDARTKLPFALQEGPKDSILVAARGDVFTLPEISAFVLRQCKAVAEAALGTTIERAVVTVPANFNDLQRAATKMAGRLAGLEVLRILNEPTAAALAYGPQGRTQERIAIYDLGGGTFDVTLLDLSGNVFEVLATAGHTTLGGDDIDVVIAERMADDLLRKHRYDVRAQPVVYGRLRILAEQMKRELTVKERVEVTVGDLVPGEDGARVEWTFRMTRPDLEWASLGLVERTFEVCARALEAASMEPNDLDRVILVGGATRMPMVARKVEQFFGLHPVQRINPDEVVALGAAIQAALLDRERKREAAHPRVNEDSVIEAIVPEHDQADDAMLQLPVVGAMVADESQQPPEEGAIEAGAFDMDLGLPTPPVPPPFGPRDEPPPLPAPPRAPMEFTFEQAPPPPPPPPRAAAPLLVDVTPLSLSVETVGGFCDVLIDANTPVPCDRTRAFSTAADGQTAVQVRVAQGEGQRFADNTFLGELVLSGIVPAPRGTPQIAVTFEIDADGILNVKARDNATGCETVARMQLVGAQTDPREVDAMAARQAAHPLAPLQG